MLCVVQARGRVGVVGMESGSIALVGWMRLGVQLNMGQQGSNVQHGSFSCTVYCEAGRWSVFALLGTASLSL